MALNGNTSMVIPEYFSPIYVALAG